MSTKFKNLAYTTDSLGILYPKGDHIISRTPIREIAPAFFFCSLDDMLSPYPPGYVVLCNSVLKTTRIKSVILIFLALPIYMQVLVDCLSLKGDAPIIPISHHLVLSLWLCTDHCINH